MPHTLVHTLVLDGSLSTLDVGQRLLFNELHHLTAVTADTVRTMVALDEFMLRELELSWEHWKVPQPTHPQRLLFQLYLGPIHYPFWKSSLRTRLFHPEIWEYFRTGTTRFLQQFPLALDQPCRQRIVHLLHFYDGVMRHLRKIIPDQQTFDGIYFHREQ